jgi:hypothetical protein
MTSKKTNTYCRLPGRARKRFGLLEFYWNRLWLADDHLLQVHMTAYSESYKRFYLKDIQAIVISRTTSGRTANVILGSVAAGFGLAGLLAAVWWKSPPAGVLLGIWAGILILALLLNTLFGPTCVCRLHTAVHVEHLTSLGRLRTARKVVGMLKPLLEAAQGKLTPEDLGAGSNEWVDVQASVHALPDQFVSSEPKQEWRHEYGRVHLALFLSLFILGLSALSDVYYQNALKNMADMACFVVSMVLTVIALRKQGRSDLPMALRRITWAVLAVLIGGYLFGSVYGAVYLMSHPDLASQSFPQEIRLQGPVFEAYCMVIGVLHSALAIAGVVLLNKFRTKYAASHTSSS